MLRQLLLVIFVLPWVSTANAGAPDATPKLPESATSNLLERLGGAVRNGFYVPMTLTEQSKLWLIRFTSPAALLNTDVSFVYKREFFCSTAKKPDQNAFHTARFAVARLEDGRYEVSDALQVKKVDLCTASPAESENYVILSKDHLGDTKPQFLINWQTGSAVAGLGGFSDRKVNVPDTPEPAVSLTVKASEPGQRHEKLDPAVLGLYARTLSNEGVILKLSPSGSVAQGGKYCIKDIAGKKPDQCFDNFSKATESLLGSLRMARTPPGFAVQSANVHAAETKPVRYELSVVGEP